MSQHPSNMILRRLIPELDLFANRHTAMQAWKDAKAAHPPWSFSILIVMLACLGTLVSLAVLHVFAIPDWARGCCLWGGTTCYSILLSAYLGHYYWRKPMRRIVLSRLEAAEAETCASRSRDPLIRPHPAKRERTTAIEEDTGHDIDVFFQHPQDIACLFKSIARHAEPPCADTFDADVDVGPADHAELSLNETESLR